MDSSFSKELVSSDTQLLKIDEVDLDEEEITASTHPDSDRLEDYLNSLICSPSTSINSKIRSSSLHIDDKRRSSVPAIQNSKDPELRSRNPSSSSDKVSRTRGSTFLDNYLGQLTDNSWLIHPIGGKKTIEKNGNTQPSSEPKVSFINVESFYDRSPVNKQSVPGRPTHGSDSQSNPEDSPSISSSIFDHDAHESFAVQRNESVKFPTKHLLQKALGNSSQTVTEATSGIGDTLDDSDPLATEQFADSISTDASLDSTGHCSSSVSPPVTSAHLCEKSSNDNVTESKGKVVNQREKDVVFAPSISENSTATELSTIVSCTNNETDIHTGKRSETPIETDSCDSSPRKKIENSQPQETSPRFTQTIGSAKSTDLAPSLEKLNRSIESLRVQHGIELDQLLKRQHEELQFLIMQSRDPMYQSILNDVNVLPNNAQRASSNFSRPEQLDQFCLPSLPQSSSGNFSESHAHASSKNPFFLHKTPDSADSSHDQPNATTSHQISRLFGAEANSKAENQNTSSVRENQETENLAMTPGFDNSIKHSADSLELLIKTRPPEFQRKFEFGLDLIPAREKDFDLLQNAQLTTSQMKGICKLQALVRGQRIRRMMATSPVQQILATLGEVAKLARQFHKDILSDNIKKGDVDFHRALFSQEKQAREKLWHLLVESSPVEQTEIISKDREMRKKSQARKVETSRSIVPRTTGFLIKETNAPKNVTKSSSMHQIRRPVSQQLSGGSSIHPAVRKTAANKVPRRSPSEPYRLCQSQKHSRLPVSKQDSSPEKSKSFGTPRKGIPKSASHSDKMKIVTEATRKSRAVDNANPKNVHFASTVGKEDSEKDQRTHKKPNQKPNKPKPQWR